MQSLPVSVDFRRCRAIVVVLQAVLDFGTNFVHKFLALSWYDTLFDPVMGVLTRTLQLRFWLALRHEGDCMDPHLKSIIEVIVPQ